MTITELTAMRDNLRAGMCGEMSTQAFKANQAKIDLVTFAIVKIEEAGRAAMAAERAIAEVQRHVA